MSGPELRIVASGPDLRTVFDKVRDRIAVQERGGTMNRDEAGGARWAIDTAEALDAIGQRRADACEVCDFIHEQTFGSVRGG